VARFSRIAGPGELPTVARFSRIAGLGELPTVARFSRIAGPGELPTVARFSRIAGLGATAARDSRESRHRLPRPVPAGIMARMSRMDSVDARRYDQGMWLLEHARLRELRQRLVEQAQGLVLEIGTGTGANLPHYAPGTQVIAVDLRPERLVAAQRKARHAAIAVAAADAHWLPFAGGVFDTVVATLVFCSLSQPAAGLAELRRVLRPGGRLLLLEHVRGQTRLTRLLTDGLHPLWFALQGECHLNRETAATVAAAGFRITHTSDHARGLVQTILATAP